MSTPPPTYDASAAVCPRCRYANDMPSECLRVEFQSLKCDSCGASLQYRGALLPEAMGSYEIITRTRPPGFAGMTQDELRAAATKGGRKSRGGRSATNREIAKG